MENRNDNVEVAGCPAPTGSEILRFVVAQHAENVAAMVSDPDGDCPGCKNRLFTFLCERCGRDVRGTTDACPAVPREKRWRFNSQNAQMEMRGPTADADKSQPLGII